MITHFRYPVLLAVDEVQALYSKTEYRNQQFERIKSYHLSLPRLLMEYLSGKKSFVCTLTNLLSFIILIHHIRIRELFWVLSPLASRNTLLQRSLLKPSDWTRLNHLVHTRSSLQECLSTRRASNPSPCRKSLSSAKQPPSLRCGRRTARCTLVSSGILRS